MVLQASQKGCQQAGRVLSLYYRLPLYIDRYSMYIFIQYTNTNLTART